MSDKGAFITGADFLVDGGATASYFYGPLKPQAQGRYCILCAICPEEELICDFHFKNRARFAIMKSG